jgi:predicted transcriptional regulator
MVEMSLQGHSNQAIADHIGCSRQRVSQILWGYRRARERRERESEREAVEDIFARNQARMVAALRALHDPARETTRDRRAVNARREMEDAADAACEPEEFSDYRANPY